VANEIPVLPPDMRKVCLRLKRWRSSHARRVPIQESLWAAAGELARAHGINPTAKALHLELNGANPFDYLTELQKHATDPAKDPAAWMPWNYRQTHQQAGTSKDPA